MQVRSQDFARGGAPFLLEHQYLPGRDLPFPFSFLEAVRILPQKFLSSTLLGYKLVSW